MQSTTTYHAAHRTECRLHGDADDISVFGAIRSMRGEWEPHVRSFLETVVDAEFACFDIGANIGAHSLSMAVLASAGSVTCFEASSRNLQFLRQNMEQARPLGCDVRVVNAAIWDTNGTLDIATVAELAGCSFVTPDADEAASEERIRRVVIHEAVRARPLSVTHAKVEAVRLDDWVAANGLRRLDFIKMDVEGAETRALSGALAILQHFRPVLVTEYNPDCALQYFGQDAHVYFDRLGEVFQHIRIIEPDGSLSEALGTWPELAARLATGRGWEDLACYFD